MEVNASSLEKKEANEVVLMISGVECQSRGSLPTPNTEPAELENPPSSSRITSLTSPSALELTQSIPAPSKLPNIPTGKSISGSSFVPHPSVTSASVSKDAAKRVPSMSPTSSVPSQVAQEEDDEDVCGTVNPESRALSGKSKVFVAQLVAFVCLTGLLIASLTIHILRNTVIWHVHLWGWCLLMLAIFCGSLVADMLIAFLVLLIEKNFLHKKKVFYFLFGLKDSAEVFAWMCLVLLAWVLLINRGVKRSRHVTKILNWVTRALASCLIGASLWLIKTFLLNLHASSFQCKKYFDRIHDQVLKFHVINELFSSAGAKIDLKVNVDKLLKMKRNKVTAWTTKNLISVVSSWEPSTLTDSLNEAEQQDEEITDEEKAKRAAKAIFKNIAGPGNKYIEESDLLPFMRKEDVERFFSFFPEVPEAKEPRKIKKSFFKVWLGSVFREQKLLTQALEDAKTAIEELNNLASAVLLIVVIILWLLLTGLLTTQVLIFISTQVVLFGFIYGEAAKRFFEAIIFVFVIHPFDARDRCVVDGVEMVVEEMNIMTTVFLKDDGEKIYFPNSELASKPIGNFYRSLDMRDSVEFTIDFSTSDERIKALREKINEYLASKWKHWRPDHDVEIKEIADADKSKILKLSLHVTHTMSFQNSAERTRRRSDLVQELKKILEQLHLDDRMPPQ